jgi:hypothetical protein
MQETRRPQFKAVYVVEEPFQDDSHSDTNLFSQSQYPLFGYLAKEYLDSQLFHLLK